MNVTTVKLLFAAGALMLLAGVIFAFMRLWIIAGLIWVRRRSDALPGR